MVGRSGASRNGVLELTLNRQWSQLYRCPHWRTVEGCQPAAPRLARIPTTLLVWEPSTAQIAVDGIAVATPGTPTTTCLEMTIEVSHAIEQSMRVAFQNGHRTLVGVRMSSLADRSQIDVGAADSSLVIIYARRNTPTGDS